jgi:hypothetical protein
VLVAVIIAADLLGLVGIVIAAPILATAQLFATYVVLKLLDKDPFPAEEALKPERSIGARLRLSWHRFRAWVRKVRNKNGRDQHQNPG